MSHLIVQLLRVFAFFAQVDPGLMLNRQRRRHTSHDNGADNSGFEFSHSHDFEECESNSSAIRCTRERGAGYADSQSCGRRDDSLSGQQGRQTRGGEGQAATREQRPQLSQRPGYPLSSCFFADAKRSADTMEIPSLEVAQHDGVALRCCQTVHCLIEDWSEMLPIRSSIVVQHIHCDSLPFSRLTATFGSCCLRGDEAGVPIEPAAKKYLLWKATSLAR